MNLAVLGTSNPINNIDLFGLNKVGVDEDGSNLGGGGGEPFMPVTPGTIGEVGAISSFEHWIIFDYGTSFSPFTNGGSDFNNSNDPTVRRNGRSSGIPTTFYDQFGRETNSIPEVVQNLFQQEYGITVGYDDGMLYKVGDYNTELDVSKNAKNLWESLLGAENIVQELVFGYDMALNVDIRNGEMLDPVRMGKYVPIQKTAFIDLADFDYSGSKIAGSFALSFSPLGFNMRSQNIARTMEHEFLGHGIMGLTNESKTVDLVNTYRKQMGLYNRDRYEHVYNRWIIDPKGVLPALNRVGQSYGNGSTILFYETTKLKKMLNLHSNF